MFRDLILSRKNLHLLTANDHVALFETSESFLGIVGRLFSNQCFGESKGNKTFCNKFQKYVYNWYH